MCIHNETQLHRVLATYTETAISAVVLRTRSGLFEAAWIADATDAKSIANSLMQLNDWHPMFRPIVDMSLINAARAKLELAPLDQAGLPAPTAPSKPKMRDGREVITEWVKAAQLIVQAQLARAEVLA